MKSIRVKQGYQPVFAGTPEPTVVSLGRPEHLAVVPEHFPFVKPKLAVKEQDAVKLGSLLFTDKKHPALRFLSPGGGVVEAIVYGKRRVVKEIRIRLDAEEMREAFPIIDADDIETMPPEEVAQRLVEGGLWPLFRALPHRNIPAPGTLPSRIYVSMASLAPFACRLEAWLTDWQKAFLFGIRILKRLCLEVHVLANQQIEPVLGQYPGIFDLAVFGSYPACDPGVAHYHLGKPEGESWFLTGQDLLLMTHLFETGTYPGERTYAVAGSLVATPRHVRTRYGAPISWLLQDTLLPAETPRFVTGGLFAGTEMPENGFMGPTHTSLTVIPEGKEKEFFGFVRAGTKKPSASRTFLSALSRKVPKRVDCNTHGELRACINCGHCEPVCPVHILPQFTMKALHADAIEEAIEHGLLDCVECGLCSYVCPSKIDLSGLFASARQTLFKEQEAR